MVIIMIIIKQHSNIIQIDPKTLLNASFIWDIRDLGHNEFNVKIEAVDFFLELKDGRKFSFRLENTDNFFLLEDVTTKYNYAITQNTFDNFQDSVHAIFSYLSGAVTKQRSGCFLELM